MVSLFYYLIYRNFHICFLLSVLSEKNTLQKIIYILLINRVSVFTLVWFPRNEPSVKNDTAFIIAAIPTSTQTFLLLVRESQIFPLQKNKISWFDIFQLNSIGSNKKKIFISILKITRNFFFKTIFRIFIGNYILRWNLSYTYLL